MNGKSYSKINSAVKAIPNSNNLRFKLDFCRLFSKRHLSGAWRYHRLDYAPQVARGGYIHALHLSGAWRPKC